MPWPKFASLGPIAIAGKPLRQSLSPLKRLAICQVHPDRRLQTAWNALQFGVVCLPLSPLVGAIAVLLAASLTATQAWASIVRRPINRALALLGIWFAIAASFALDTADAFIGLLNFLPFFAVFTCLSALIQQPKQLRRLAWLFAIASIPVSLIGCGQLFWGWSGPIRLGIIDWPLVAGGLPPDRMAAVFAHANVFASYLTIVFILVVGLWFDLWQQEVHPRLQRFWSRVVLRKSSVWTNLPKTLWLKLSLLSLALLGNGIALVFTHSRNGWIATALGCLALAIYHRWYWIVASMAALVSAVLGAAFSPAPIKGSLRAIVPAFFWARLIDRDFDRPVGTLRITQWQFAGSLSQQRPLFGWGLRNFGPLYEQQTAVWMSHPHNLFLMLAAETGIPAVLGLCGIVSWILTQGVLCLRQSNWATTFNDLKRDRQWLFAYLVAFGATVVFNLMDITLFDLRINLMGWLLLAGIAGTVSGSRELSVEGTRSQPS